MDASSFMIGSMAGLNALASDAPGADWPDAATRSADAAIHIIRGTADPWGLTRFRQELCIQGEALRRGSGDGDRAGLTPLGRRSLVFVAMSGGEAVASLWLSRAADAIVDAHLRRLVEAAAPESLATALIVSGFTVKPDPAARAMIVPLLLQAYRCAHLAGATESFTATQETLVGVFASRGWRRTGRTLTDTEVGPLQVMRSTRLDLGAFQQSGSPLASVAADFLKA